MPPEKPPRQKGGGIGQSVGPPDLRPPGATHVDHPTVLVAHGDEEVRSTLVDRLQRTLPLQNEIQGPVVKAASRCRILFAPPRFTS
jgi:hypothetical protein